MYLNFNFTPVHFHPDRDLKIDKYNNNEGNKVYRSLVRFTLSGLCSNHTCTVIPDIVGLSCCLYTSSPELTACALCLAPQELKLGNVLHKDQMSMFLLIGTLGIILCLFLISYKFVAAVFKSFISRFTFCFIKKTLVLC